MHFEISVPNPETHTYKVSFFVRGIDRDTLVLRMPQWMPGYYQIINYAKDVINISVSDEKGSEIPIEKLNGNSWCVKNIRNRSFEVHYQIKAERQFVAVSYVDTMHAYIAPTNTFLYIDGFLNTPVTVKIIPAQGWRNIATGLDLIPGSSTEFRASDFDILYDCPILIGNLEELPSFYVKGIEHRFIGYKLGNFDKEAFMKNLKKVVETAVNLMGDIPYKKYTFIAIGPGQGGIEHLNNTTISFDGNHLNSIQEINRVLTFIAHEYFHNYNVKRIRPFELGPFDYNNENRTNLLWVSEGLSVYYQYQIVKRAGLIDENTLFSFFEKDINTYKNDHGRFYQSLAQASYYTWEDGPFGARGGTEDKSISYYEKGPIVGLLLDLAIRNASENKKSLDDVMRLVYQKYYLELRRGFTDAEFQQVCESVAGASLTEIFEYVYSTKELDFEKYLGFAGLTLEKQAVNPKEKFQSESFKLARIKNPDSRQLNIFESWVGK